MYHGGAPPAPTVAREPALSLLDAVDVTIGALTPAAVDAAAVDLARLYARQIDQAATVRAQADKALRAAERDGDPNLVELVAALRAKLGERDTLDRIGARLHALLVELQATPKSRAGQPAAPVAGSSALGRLRSVTG